MEKFKKLSREEMKNIKGGQYFCPNGDYVLCASGCLQVESGAGGASPAGWCGYEGSTYVSPLCFSDSGCTHRAF
jgi:hypothetical protein